MINKTAAMACYQWGLDCRGLSGPDGLPTEDVASCYGRSSWEKMPHEERIEAMEWFHAGRQGEQGPIMKVTCPACMKETSSDVEVLDALGHEVCRHCESRYAIHHTDLDGVRHAALI